MPFVYNASSIPIVIVILIVDALVQITIVLELALTVGRNTVLELAMP